MNTLLRISLAAFLFLFLCGCEGGEAPDVEQSAGADVAHKDLGEAKIGARTGELKTMAQFVKEAPGKQRYVITYINGNTKQPVEIVCDLKEDVVVIKNMLKEGGYTLDTWEGEALFRLENVLNGKSMNVTSAGRKTGKHTKHK